MICVDLEKLEQVTGRTIPQEDDGVVPTHPHSLPEHRPPITPFLSCQLVLCTYRTFSFTGFSPLSYSQKIATFVPFLENWSRSSPASFNIISGVLPPAVSAFFGFFLPIMMRWLSRYQGALTHSRLDRAVVARYFAFLVISQLIIFTLIGVIFSA